MTDTTLVRIRNISPQGPLEVPLLRGLVVGRGETVDVTPDQAARLTAQSVWEHVDDATTRPAASASRTKWAAHAEHLGLTVTRDQSKKDIIAAVDALEAATTETSSTETDAGNQEKE